MTSQDHANPQTPQAVFEEQHDRYKASFLRITETMCWDLIGLFSKYPRMTAIEYDQDGDPSNYPQLMATDDFPGGEGLQDDDAFREDAEEIEQRWNDASHPAVVSFLETNEGQSFKRESLAEDIANACQKTAQQGDFPQDWATSFATVVKGYLLEKGWEASPVAPRKPGARF